ncbi:hypothetical protein [Streptomyces shenzhenensis]|uniref:hypothetical protein n=1 Tax=Streptomyces shenzhenensis TaxID=943815 RepID=UPI0033F86DB6
MSHEVGLTATAYGFGAGIFFIAYFLFELPSNAGTYRFGVRNLAPSSPAQAPFQVWPRSTSWVAWPNPVRTARPRGPGQR